VGKRIIKLTESDLERLIRKIIKEGTYEGVNDGKIQYKTNNGEIVCYELTHNPGRFLPNISILVDNFNFDTKEFKLSYIGGVIEGRVDDEDKMNKIVYNMERGTSSFDIPMGKENKIVTFSIVNCN
jgi:hypothetical protein